MLAKLAASGGQRSKVAFLLRNAFRAKGPLSQEREKFYGNLSRDAIRKLIRIYKIDYEMFGYDYSWACKDC